MPIDISYTFRMKQTVVALVADATRTLAEAGAESPRLAAQLLLGHVLGLDRLHVELACEQELAEKEIAAARALVRRHAAGEPMAHLLGRREFYGRDFAVNAHTLVPRPDTEVLVDTVLRLMPDNDTPVCFADLGAGSGCIGLTLACERLRWHGILLELDAQALTTAQANACFLGVAERVRCVRGDMFTPPLRAGCLDVLVANPPYIAHAERAEVMPEVLRYEPHTALFSENNGLAHLAACIDAGRRLLKTGGWIVLEHGYRQGEAVRSLLSEAGFAQATTVPDLAGRDRCSFAQQD